MVSNPKIAVVQDLLSMYMQVVFCHSVIIQRDIVVGNVQLDAFVYLMFLDVVNTCLLFSRSELTGHTLWLQNKHRLFVCLFGLFLFLSDTSILIFYWFRYLFYL